MMRKTAGAAVCALLATAAQAAPALDLPPFNWMTPASPRPHNRTQGRVVYYMGTDLYELCQTDEFACAVYIQGTIDGQMAAVIGTNRDVAYCIPGGSKPQQVKDVVKRLGAHLVAA